MIITFVCPPSRLRLPHFLWQCKHDIVSSTTETSRKLELSMLLHLSCRQHILLSVLLTKGTFRGCFIALKGHGGVSKKELELHLYSVKAFSCYRLKHSSVKHKRILYERNGLAAALCKTDLGDAENVQNQTAVHSNRRSKKKSVVIVTYVGGICGDHRKILHMQCLNACGK